jgi:hypothetical protein
MNVNQLKESRFLTRHDCGKGILVTIDGDVFQENMAKDGDEPELKWCLKFVEQAKPMTLNFVNQQTIGEICGEETEGWNGKQIVLFDEPNVMMGQKKVGGIRVRAPRNQLVKAPAAPVAAPKHGMLGKPANRPAPAPVQQQEPEPSDEDGEGDFGVPF